MLKRWFRLAVVPVLIFSVAALSGFAQTGSANTTTCEVAFHGCSEPDFECCCGLRAICASHYQECVDLCG